MEDPVLEELRELTVMQRRVEATLHALRQEQRQVSCNVRDVLKEVGGLTSLASQAARAHGGGDAVQHEASNAASAVINTTSSETTMRPEEVQWHVPVVATASPPLSRNASWAAAGESSNSEMAMSPQVSGRDVEALEPEQVEVRAGRYQPAANSPLAEEEECVGSDGLHFVAPMLPLSWPEVIAVRTSFDEPPARVGRSGGSDRYMRTASSLTSLEASFGRVRSSAREAALESSSGGSNRGAWAFFFSSLRDEEKREGWLASIILRPTSVVRALFDVLGCLALAYDLTVNPLVFAWDIPLAGSLETLAWLTCVFWTLEMVASSVTGYDHGSRIELTPQKVLRHYLRTWCIPDLAITTADWLSILPLSVSKPGVVTLRMVAKLGRLLRLVVKWHTMKFVRAIEDITEGSMSELQRTFLRVLLMLLGTLWLNHLICCAWIAVGRTAHSDTGMRWVNEVRESGGDALNLLEAAPGYQYATAFHWSMATLASGEIEISCFNTAERMFNIVILVIGLLFSSTLVSSLSAAMVEMQMRMRETRTKLMRLRRFLRENQVDRRVSLRVQQQAADRLGRKQRLIEKDVTVINLLSSSLRAQLRFEICRRYICTHPLFRLWTAMDVSAGKRICMEAADISYLRQQDDLFTAGTSTDKAYYVIDGALVYSQDPESSAVETEEHTEVGAETWLSEASLWSHWTHVGTAEVRTPVEVLNLSAGALVSTLRRHPAIHEVALEYCKHFHRRIVSAKPPDALWPSDLQVPFTDYGDLVTSMKKEVQVSIGLSAISQVSQQTSSWAWHFARVPTGLHKLREEVEKGKSVVMINGAGNPERVVSVVVLRATDRRGRVFAQLGTLDADGVHTSCQLPGGKQERGELTMESLKRILQAKLEPLAGSVEITGTQRKVEWKLSREYGIQTKYLRTICSARLEQPAERGQCHLIPVTEGAMFDVSREIRNSIQARTPFAVAGKDREVLFAWLWEEELRHLSSPAGEADATWWLNVIAQNKESIVTLQPKPRQDKPSPSVLGLQAL